MENTHPLFGEQAELETEMRSLGVDRYRRLVEAAEEKGRAGELFALRPLMERCHVALKEAILKFYETIEVQGKGGRNNIAYKVMKPIDVDLMAHLTIKSIIDEIASPNVSLTNAAASIGMMIEDELHYQSFKAQDKRGFDFALAKAKKSPSLTYKRRHLREVAAKKGIAFEAWEQDDRVRLGLKLIELLIESTGMVETKLIWIGTNNCRQVIQASEDTVAWIDEVHKRTEWMHPTLLPTIIPPRPWESVYSGGYWTRAIRRLTLVKTPDTGYLAELEDRDLSRVLAAVNAVQETPWRINQRVLYAIARMRDMNATFGVIPSPEKVDFPAKPFWLQDGMKKEHMNEAQAAEFMDWKKRCSETYSENAANTCRRIQFSRIFWVADKFSKYEEIYFPHQLDFRGRIYPIPMYLQPQGNDLCRGLLEFSEGKPIGSDPEARMWYFSHGAGLWGVDKVPMADRERWIMEHAEVFLEIAHDPMSNLFWTEAEKPFQALAFAIDVAEYLTNPDGHCSHLPIQMDGSCNGLQHLSAMLRDPVGGKAVNLIPGERPSDIYQMVADVVAEQARADAERDNTLAQGWLGHITRKVCKRPVMTLAYGAKQYGFSEQVYTDTIAPWRVKDPAGFPFKDAFKSAQYLGGAIWHSVGHVVVAAREAMDWLHKVTSVVSRKDMPLYWETPVGFLVKQAYRKPSTKRIETLFHGAIIKLMVDVGLPSPVDAKRQSNGVSPNFVHSMDASHLMLTVLSAKAEGVTNFSLIHDSYGTHACDCPKLARILRDEFVLMYEQHDVLQEFLDRQSPHFEVGDEVPPMPSKGDLDLSEVRKSVFFFA